MKTIEPSWQALQLLAALAEEQGLLHAATRVGLSPSAASHALSKLERTLNVALVSRDRKGLRLSEAGSRLIPHINQALGSLDAMRQEIAQLSGLQAGALRVAAVPSLAGSWVPTLIRDFSRKYPTVEVNLFEGTDNEVADWVLNSVAHVGFAALPVPKLATQELTRDEWLALLPATRYPIQRIQLASLAKRKFLLSGGGCETHITALFAEAGLPLPASRLMIKQTATIEAMVAQGLGVSLVPETALAGSRKKVVAVPLSPRRFRSIGLLLPPTSTHSHLVDAWTSLVRAHFGLIPQT